MATRRRKGTSLKRIITEIHKARKKISKQQEKATSRVTIRRLSVRLRRLDRVETAAEHTCRGMGLYVR